MPKVASNALIEQSINTSEQIGSMWSSAQLSPQQLTGQHEETREFLTSGGSSLR